MADRPPGFDPGWAGLEREPLVFLDFEATGAMPGDRIIEMGAILVHGDEILESFHSFVDPEVPVPEPIRRIHGISEDLLCDAPSIGEALEALFCFFDRARGLCAHHAPADMRFLAYDALRAGMTLPDLPVLDTKVMARRMLGRRAPASLSALCQHYGIPSEPRHRALPDAKSTFLLFRQLLLDAVKQESRYWTWPRPVSLMDATLPRGRLPAEWSDLEPTSPPSEIQIRYGSGEEVDHWIAIQPLASVEGKRGPWLRARESSSGIFRFYQLRKIHAMRRGKG